MLEIQITSNIRERRRGIEQGLSKQQTAMMLMLVLVMKMMMMMMIFMVMVMMICMLVVVVKYDGIVLGNRNPIPPALGLNLLKLLI